MKGSASVKRDQGARSSRRTHRVADDADRVARCEPGQAAGEARAEVDEACKERVVLFRREHAGNQYRDDEAVDGNDACCDARVPREGQRR